MSWSPGALKLRTQRATEALLNRALLPVLRARRCESPIFLLGHDRSGSTWLGRSLALADRTIYIHEPINGHASRIGDWAGYNVHLVPGQRDALYERVFDLAVAGAGVRDLRMEELGLKLFGKPDLIIKETGGMMCGEWFQQRYEARIVVLSRHPVPVILSNMRMGEDNASNWLAKLAAQPGLMEDCLADVADAVRAANSADVVTKFAVVYCMRHRALYEQLERHADWIHVFYEDVCASPVERFRGLYARLGLDFSPRCTGEIERMSTTDGKGAFFGTDRVSKANAWAWKQTAGSAHIEKIRKVCDTFRMPFYSLDEDWRI